MLISPTPFPLPELARSLSALAGVGPATAKALAKRGLRTWGDTLLLLPRRYEDRRHPKDMADLDLGVLAVVRGRVKSSGLWGRRGKVYRIVIEDDSGSLVCLWFRFKKAHLSGYAPGDELILVGKPEEAPGGAGGGGLQMIHPEVYRADEVGPGHTSVGRLAPVYPLTEGVRAGSLRKIMAGLMERTLGKIDDPLFGLLPPDMYAQPAGAALAQAHTPPLETGAEELDPESASWRRVLAVNELFYFELGLALKRVQRVRGKARAIDPEGELLSRLMESLPFELTPGQAEAVQTIRRDLAQSHPMGRLLSGDVGTGKTVVAAAGAAIAAEAGVQTAIMAPTEVLARQHYRSLTRMLEPLGIGVTLATGSMNGAQRREAKQAMNGEAMVVVGTHALFSKDMEFRDLGLVIIDEQHRFGVHQRLKLAAKGAGGAEQPHMLVLSATPIPRTLALALAGHLDISGLPEKPHGGPPIATEVIGFDQRKQAVDAIAGALEKSEQVYVICPLVQASDAVEAQDVTGTHARMQSYFSETKVGLLHGRMEADEQQAALEDFKAGRTRILAATTVVEVGVDVPGATLMVVLGAERFGLSQLHQLRGRVGRGEKPGRCLLVSGPEPSDLALERLTVLAAAAEGGQVAEADLLLRGPGEALGEKQSGLPPFRVARWDRDAEEVPVIRRIIEDWLRHDPQMAGPELSPIKAETLRRWGRRLGLAAAG